MVLLHLINLDKHQIGLLLKPLSSPSLSLATLLGHHRSTKPLSTQYLLILKFDILLTEASKL